MHHSKYSLSIAVCLALAGLAASCSDDAKKPAHVLTCEPGLAICGHGCCDPAGCCDGVCVDIKNDKENCGACGNACGDQVCSGGSCMANEEACKNGQEWCAGGCVSTQSDPKHCGDCATACKDNEVCRDGGCVVGCAQGFTNVGDGKCVDLNRDSENCGEKGVICGDNAYCADGACTCLNGHFDCNDDMTDGCESKFKCDAPCKDESQQTCPGDMCCDKSETCCGDTCCEAGTACCGDAGCLDLQNDVRHCGSCTKACNADEICQEGACVPNETECETEGEIACWGTCTDRLTDKNNCGECGHACDEDQTCTNGECTISCADGETVCIVDTEQFCADLNKDPMNCGQCFVQCSETQVCVESEEGTECKEMSEVDPTFVCENAVDPETDTETVMTQCWDKCVDLKTDAKHCGSCQNSCQDGYDCVEGVCTKHCESGLNACGDTCRNLQSDPQACGNCETRCADNQTCVDGDCADFELDCNADADPEAPDFVEKTACWGTCVDLKSDTANCGSCGNACPSEQICADGNCQDKTDPGACNAPKGLCYGECKDLMNDNDNCGSCLNTCGTGELCIEGVCTLQCGNELTNCDNKGCVSTATSKKHCGTCGHECNDGEDCVGSACQCAPGRYDCDGVAANGCESTEKCVCTPNKERKCWRGDEANLVDPANIEAGAKGACQVGSQICDVSGQFWGPCTGGVYPSAVTCNDVGVYIGGDQNCNGVDDSTEECVSSCDLRLTDSSYIGCEYWPVYLNNSVATNHSIVISNPSQIAGDNATVYIFNKTGYTNATPSPIKTLTVPANGLAVNTLSTGNTNMLSTSGTTTNAYRVRSNKPITLYQFNPWSSATAYSNDASLLLPTNVLASKYRVNNWDGGYASVVAVEPGTTVVNVAGTKYTLSQFQTQTVTGTTGTLIEAENNKKIIVYSGNSCVKIPSSTEGYCDHLEEELFPVQAWGKSYFAVQANPRGTTTGDFFRILADQDGTQVTLPSNLGGTFTLNAGQYRQVESRGAFEVKANKAISLMQILPSSMYGNNHTGDPSMLLVVPYEQYRTDYAFMVPETYNQNFVTVVMEQSGSITLDGKDVNTSGYTAISGTNFKYGYISINPGTHIMHGTKPFGLSGYGWFPDCSYGYPIGLDLKRINNTN